MTAAARKIRPPKQSRWRDLYRLTDDLEWVPDDGEPGLAFYGRGTPYGGIEPSRIATPYAFSYGTRDYRDSDIQRMAMRACCDRYRCANGRLVNGNGVWA